VPEHYGAVGRNGSHLKLKSNTLRRKFFPKGQISSVPNQAAASTVKPHQASAFEHTFPRHGYGRITSELSRQEMNFLIFPRLTKQAMRTGWYLSRAETPQDWLARHLAPPHAEVAAILWQFGQSL
jgi:hypothetical protein